MKKCGKCKLEKPLSEFHKLNSKKGTFGAVCKQCKKEYDVIYRKGEKVQSLYKSKAYRDRKKDYMVQRYSKNHSHYLLANIKSRCKRKGIPFNLEESDIVIPDKCPILGIPIIRKEYTPNPKDRKTFVHNSASVDRIIPELGYVKGNIMVISMKANIMKHNATLEELITFSKNILKLYDNSSSILSTNNVSNESSI